MIEIRALSAGYSGRTVIHSLDLTVPRGKITVIVGPNGCGKSTLLKTLAGILPASGGSVLLDGRELASLSPRERAQSVAYLAQGRQVPEITALRLVLHGRFPYLSYPRRYRREDREIAMGCLERMGVAHLADRPLHTLSGGTRQKVYIAMALAQDTPAVLLDEPTTYLDVPHQMQMMELARLLADEGKTVVPVLHDLTLALRTADCLAVMEEGRLAASGTPEEVLASGRLEQVFGVAVRSVDTPDGTQYYYAPGKEC